MMDERDDEEEGEDRRTAALAGLALVLALLIGGVLLARALHRESTVEDCLLAGRRTCEAGR